MFSHYQRLLLKQPLLTKAATAATLMAASDLACQSMEDRSHSSTKSSIDYQRTAHVGITGLLWTGPMTHAWYQLLERFVPPTTSSRFTTSHLPTTIRTAMAHRLGTKLLLDAFVFSPVAVAGYFGVRSLLENGANQDALTEKLQSLWQPALVSSWYFWPAANVINFTMVPLPLRVLYNNVLSFFWNSYLTELNSKDKHLTTDGDITQTKSTLERSNAVSESFSTTFQLLS